MNDPTPLDERLSEDELSVLVPLTMLLRYRSLVLVFLVVAGAGAVLVRLWAGADYISTSNFSPQVADRRASAIAGLAAQFGFAMGNDAGESLEFYAELINSRSLLQAVAHTEFDASRLVCAQWESARNLVDIFEVSGGSPTEINLNVVEELRARTGVSLDLQAGLVTVRTQAKCAGLAEAINQRVLDLVSEFNLQRRSFRARAEREFIEARLAEAQSALRDAESRLEGFLEQNRDYSNSPTLTFEAARLERRMDLRQQVVTSLAQAYEQARIDEVRNTPVITIIDDPVQSAERRRGLFRAGVFGLGLGLATGVVAALGRGYLERYRRASPEEFVTLTEEWNNTLRSLRLRR